MKNLDIKESIKTIELELEEFKKFCITRYKALNDFNDPSVDRNDDLLFIKEAFLEYSGLNDLED